MSRREVTRVTDDLDGTAPARPVRLGLGGRAWVIDLSEANAARLAADLEPFIAAARKARQGKPDRRTMASRHRSAQIRAWAIGQGLVTLTAGRIPAAVVRAWHEAGRP